VGRGDLICENERGAAVRELGSRSLSVPQGTFDRKSKREGGEKSPWWGGGRKIRREGDANSLSNRHSIQEAKKKVGEKRGEVESR